MTNDPTIADVEAAMSAAEAFVEAVAQGDEHAALALSYGPSLNNWDLSNGVIGQWRQGPAAAYFGRSSPSRTARVIDGRPTGEPPLVCIGFVIPSIDELWRPVVAMDGPREALAITMIESSPGRWQVWGSPPTQEWPDARLVEIPITPTGPVQ